MRIEELDDEPSHRGGYALWEDREGACEVRFLGRGPGEERIAALSAVESAAPAVAWARQIHSARLLPATAGFCGEGDALAGSTSGLALSVITADCVPVLLASASRLVAVHAGWRGIVAGIVPRAADELGSAAPRTAWIGPAIGPCCYEVGEDVAVAVAAASRPDVVVRGTARPHLDLLGAVLHQLEAAGIEALRILRLCTGCRSDLLWSYRRDGARAGRNMAFIWRHG